jgi:hypothetical protein
MQQILKRLELIKTGIALEDEEVISLQVEKLSSMEVDAEVMLILSLAANCDYGRTVREIDAFLAKYKGVILYEDEELLGLRMELKALESRVQSLSEQRDECLFSIREFNTRYTARLGDLIEKILRAKADRLSEQILEADLANETLKAAHEQAEKEYEEFSGELDEVREEGLRELSDEDAARLKKAYRDASRLCHPDLVPDELKEQAHQMMQQLNEAYAKRDLARVEEILAALKSGNGFELASDTITDKALLKKKIESLRGTLATLQREVDDLQADETFEIIRNVTDWDEYFDNIRQQLTEEYRALVSEEALQLEGSGDVS